MDNVNFIDVTLGRLIFIDIYAAGLFYALRTGTCLF
jgi:hypothetical protein